MTNLLSVREAAVYAQLSVETIRRGLRDGSLHGFQRGKNARWMIEERCVEAWQRGLLCPHRKGAPRRKSPRV